MALSVKNELTGRLVYSIDAIPIVYEIKEYRTSTNEVIMKRLFDTNGILLEGTRFGTNIKSANEDSFLS